MAWPTERRLLGTRVTRLDGPAKVAGAAKYAYDQNPAGLCHAAVLYSPVGRLKVTRLDVTKAQAMPGVRAVLTLKSAGDEARYHGEYLAAVAADTEEQARDARRAIDFAYEELPAAATEEAAMAADAPKLIDQGNTRPEQPKTRGDVDAALAQAAAVYEQTFRCHVVTHVCLETHGATAAWDGDKVTVWSSTQGVSGIREGIAHSVGVSPANVEVICEYMGGGFGSKLGGPMEEVTAAKLAKLAGRPVKLMLDREQEHTYAGCRNSVVAKVKFAADKDGKLVAVDASSYGTGGIYARGSAIQIPSGIYRVANARHQHTDVAINAGNQRAMRAPGHPLMSFVTESALEGLAEKLGQDPLAFRRRNIPEGALWHKQLDLGAERIGWRNRPATGSQTGRYRRGLGVALTAWGGGGHNSNARLAIHSDGQVEIWCATQDIGTGSRTALAIVVAETLGLRPEQITVHVGHASYPPSGASGGSTTIGGISPAARVVAEKGLAALCDKVAPTLGTTADDLEVGPAGLRRKSQPGQTLTWQAACARLGPDTVSVEGARDPALGGSGVNGAQFAEVEVDTETGITRVKRMIALQDCGLIVNRLAAESQVIGGVIMGIGFALFEERILDPNTARMLNPNMEFYKVPGPSDMPEIEVLMQDQPERGVIGVGEPPTVPTAAAIANAVSNAIGRRVTELPITPMQVLTLLERKEGSA